MIAWDGKKEERRIGKRRRGEGEEERRIGKEDRSEEEKSIV